MKKKIIILSAIIMFVLINIVMEDINRDKEEVYECHLTKIQVVTKDQVKEMYVVTGSILEGDGHYVDLLVSEKYVYVVIHRSGRIKCYINNKLVKEYENNEAWWHVWKIPKTELFETVEKPKPYTEDIDSLKDTNSTIIILENKSIG